MNLYNIPDLIIGSIFLLSIITKISNIAEFKYEVLSYKFIPQKFLNFVVILIILLEFGVVFTSAIHSNSYIIKLFPLLLLIVFTIIYSLKKIFNTNSNKDSCGCFGELKMLNAFPLQRNMMLIIVSIIDFILSNNDRDMYDIFTILSIEVTIALITLNLVELIKYFEARWKMNT
ncbi:MauE/DoxX family redox-associated membrane protein [Paenibacillus alkalitolerans]|uniref:MauE/DoxX family redox-associated membrane protein n=1 Tax=Paenibacillus alkalitolerans TaxID=2799335 RepID=UPI00389967E9